MCPGCNQDTLVDVTKAERIRTHRRTCTCDGYFFPHHKGTEPWCINAKIGPDDQDYEDRYRRFG